MIWAFVCLHCLWCELTLGATASQADLTNCICLQLFYLIDLSVADFFVRVPYEMRYNESGCTHMIICCGNVHLLIMQ